MQRIARLLDHPIASGVVTMLFLFVIVRPLPIFPDLMTEGLVHAINRAIANHLVFGRDIVFTYGPYVPVYQSQYFPGTEVIRLVGQAAIALCYSIAFLTLFHGLARLTLLPLAYLITVGNQPLFADAIFYLVPWFFVLLAFRYSSRREVGSDWRSYLRFGFFTLTLSLVALIKGSFMLGSSCLLALGLVLIARRDGKLALALAAIFVIGFVSLWALVGSTLR